MFRRLGTGMLYDAESRALKISVAIPGTNGLRRKHHTFHGLTKEEARIRGAEFRAEMLRGSAPATKPLSLAEFTEAKDKLLFASCSPRTRQNALDDLKTSLSPFFGDQPVAEIVDEDVDSFQQNLQAKGLQGATINIRVRLLKKLLRAAHRWRLRSDVPHFPKPLEERRAVPMSQDEQRALLEAFQSDYAASNPRFRRSRWIFTAALETGLGRADLINLRWSDLTEGFIAKRRQKTGVPVTVPISPVMAQVLTEIRAGGITSEFVFTTERNKPYSVVTLQKYFVKAKELARISRRLRLYDLRHSFATNMLNRGMPFADLSRMLGHTDLRVSQTYARVSNLDLEGLRERFMARFGDLQNAR